MVVPSSERDPGRDPTVRDDRAAHPVWKANLLMAAVTLLLVALAVLSTVGGR